ncbi:lipoprotein insertase outer membrane protein LolB [Acidovorax sp. Leaf160]|uniref:lipoprotein insertase outer membrane protein LolB n=1 Tax=Acidovorax sp. Leaf160 TaxID=1736280 RepID=UPI0006FF73D9|nr:lipoprotein insertase outer membrane protein LolB [Acidovorax sp. Leaf160]KQR50186.1 hypothetical protein ASF94_06840 [Acidovorax sp. Leaf160]
MTPANARRPRAWLACASLCLLAACAQPPAPKASTDPAMGAWSGRLSLQVDDAAAQSFSAGFELNGRPEQGQLTVLNPLGNVMATIDWSPGKAVLVEGGQRRESDSLDALVQETTGSALPVAALFGWLRGEAVQATGWQADLSRIDEGRLVAQRLAPPPQATLRVVLSR